jgi:hypothetical protein
MEREKMEEDQRKLCIEPEIQPEKGYVQASCQACTEQQQLTAIT